MADKTDQQLATEAAARAGAAVNEQRDPTKVRSSIRAAAAAARAAIPAGAGRLDEPTIADAGSAVVPRTGAAPDSGAAPAPGTKEVPVVMVDDKEYEQLEKQQREGGKAPAEGEGEGEKKPPATEAAREGEGEGEAGPAEGEERPEGEESREGWTAVEIPALVPGEAARVIDIEDPELAGTIARLASGYARRQQLATIQEDVDQAREEMAQLEDALQVDPVNYVVEHVRPQIQIDLARALLAQPAVFDAVVAEFGGLEGEALRQKALQIENDRLTRQSQAARELSERSRMRVQGRGVDRALQIIVPDDMDQATAVQLYKDMRRDVAEFIASNRGIPPKAEDLPDILGRRLAMYGITADYAAERLADTEQLRPLPIRARGARANGDGNGAPARSAGRQPARTAERVVAQADRRRAAAAVPGGGAGVPAQAGWVLPRRQGVKGRIGALREILGLS
jgi:hypothetical protein